MLLIVMKNYIKNHIHVVVPALLLLAAFISSVAIYFGRIEQYRDWKQISGYVVGETELRHFRVAIDYTYMVNGVDYTSRESFHDTPDFEFPPPGSSVTIWYDPDRPQLSSYYKPTPGLDPLGTFFAAVPLSAAVYLTYTGKNLHLRGRVVDIID